MQAIQEVFVAKEWVNDTHNKARVEAKLCVEANRALGTCEQKNKELTKNVAIEHSARLSAETGLKNAEALAEDQLQQLHITEIHLATQRQLVLELKAELEKAKEEARMARKASEAAEMASFKRGVLDMKVRLAKEVVGVCRDYYTEVWAEALNWMGVPANSKLGKAKSIFFPEDIWEAPTVLLPLDVLPLPPFRQISTIQALSIGTRVSTVAGKGQEVSPLVKDTHSEDAFTIKDVVSQGKDAEFKSKDGDAKLKAADSKA